MLDLNEVIDSQTDNLEAIVTNVCRRIPPLWDLKNYVAVNPFIGFSQIDIAHAAEEIFDGLGAQVLPLTQHYREMWARGAFSLADLKSAGSRFEKNASELKDILDGTTAPPLRTIRTTLTVAEKIDRSSGSNWSEQVNRVIAKWLSYIVLGSGSSLVWSDEVDGLYSQLVEAARLDRTLDISGLKGWRTWFAAAPATSSQALQKIATDAYRPPISESYLYRVLCKQYGWACYLRHADWPHSVGSSPRLTELMAFLLLCETALLSTLGQDTIKGTDDPPTAVESEEMRLIFQEAAENSYARRLSDSLNDIHCAVACPKPDFQLVFCIDVRSEPVRRNLEKLSSTIQTCGFAGFFGAPINWEDESGQSARCPVLLSPQYTVSGNSGKSNPVESGLNAVLRAPSAFSFVELFGLSYAVRLFGDALAGNAIKEPEEYQTPIRLNEHGDADGIDLDHRISLAYSMLKNSGLAGNLSRNVVLCGHGGRSENNLHASGLDCGACGGKSGALNARVMCQILNQPEVRTGLQGKGLNIPSDTHFTPALHNTSSEEVELLDIHTVPETHIASLVQLRGLLAKAATEVRAERAQNLNVLNSKVDLKTIFRNRAADWSELRPEWGLARNAAFIAAPRSLTREVDLAGRVFLHDYDAEKDQDSSILSMIISAPMVVATWINLQYLASTVDNEILGCGRKALQNRVGTIGVVLGNGGDLKTGLSYESVFNVDGSCFHEPLRLQSFIQAPVERIEKCLKDHANVGELVDHGWIRLFSIDPQTGKILRRDRGRWTSPF